MSSITAPLPPLSRPCPSPPHPTSPPRARCQAHLVAFNDSTCPLVGLVQLMPAVGLLQEPRLLFGRVVVPKTRRLCFGDKFYVINKDERLEYGPGEKGGVLQLN